MMRRTTIVLGLVATIALGGVALRGALVAKADEAKWSGELVDLACYLAAGKKGPGHAKCAAMCAEQGQPVGLLADDGKLYILVASHEDMKGFEDAKEWCGKMATLSGKGYERDGVRAIEVHKVGEHEKK